MTKIEGIYLKLSDKTTFVYSRTAVMEGCCLNSQIVQGGWKN